MRLTTDFDKLGFHDASIENIERQSGSIILVINGAFISKEHPKSEGFGIQLKIKRPPDIRP